MVHQRHSGVARRGLLTGAGLALGAMAGAARADAKYGGSVTAASAIHQEQDFIAPPQRIFEILMDSKQFSAATGFKAEMAPGVCGAFSLFGGHITGRHLDLVPGRRIVQAWRVDNWPEGLWSIARFELIARGTGTHVVFDHTGYPLEEAEHLALGWLDHYWTPLRAYLG